MEMDTLQTPAASLTILTALAAEAEALDRQKQKTDPTGAANTLASGKQTTKIIQCGIGRDTLLRIAAPQLKRTQLVGNIGVSGGLTADLKPGMVILADRILTAGRNRNSTYQAVYTPNSQILAVLESNLQKKGVPYRRGSLLCTRYPLESPEKKRAAQLETGALAVDMESSGAAEAARLAALPFFCMRLVCDPAERWLDTRLLAGVDSQGNNRPGRLIKPLLRRPWSLRNLLLMAHDFNRALAGMQQAWSVVRGPLVDYTVTSLHNEDE
jgi:nucleoside phosphorylase